MLFYYVEHLVGSVCVCTLSVAESYTRAGVTIRTLMYQTHAYDTHCASWSPSNCYAMRMVVTHLK